MKPSERIMEIAHELIQKEPLQLDNSIYFTTALIQYLDEEYEKKYHEEDLVSLNPEGYTKICLNQKGENIKIINEKEDKNRGYTKTSKGTYSDDPEKDRLIKEELGETTEGKQSESKLKTLKDIDFSFVKLHTKLGDFITVRDGEVLSEVLDIITEEAKKWVEELEKDDDTFAEPKTKHELYDSFHATNENVKDFIKHFFNLEEE